MKWKYDVVVGARIDHLGETFLLVPGYGDEYRNELSSPLVAETTHEGQPGIGGIADHDQGRPQGGQRLCGVVHILDGAHPAPMTRQGGSEARASPVAAPDDERIAIPDDFDGLGHLRWVG